MIFIWQMGSMITSGLNSKSTIREAYETVFANSDSASDVIELDEDINSSVKEEIEDEEEKITSNQGIAVLIDKSLVSFHKESISEKYFKQLIAPPECKV
ncbi:MAG: hypothetical protein EP305_08780 [Bacteroidetes bacterium]|nr:MAG: hypothetical protein EP305_08780 [Bacteroidota bacterium]